MDFLTCAGMGFDKHKELYSSVGGFTAGRVAAADYFDVSGFDAYAAAVKEAGFTLHGLGWELPPAVPKDKLLVLADGHPKSELLRSAALPNVQVSARDVLRSVRLIRSARARRRSCICRGIRITTARRRPRTCSS